MTAEPLLSVRDLTVVFDGRKGALTALDGVSFDMAPGEILGVVGEPGAGESLTGTAIIGLLDPPGRIAGGSIHFARQCIDNLTSSAMRELRGRHIGAIFQDPLTSLHPLLTVGDQLVETIRTHLPIGRDEARTRALHLLTDVGIPSPDVRIDQYPHQFSGGMRQRVVIALALCAAPRLVVADEPTTAPNVSIQAQITTLLKRLCREQQTAVMLVTHDMGVIAETADRVAVMYAGRIVELGPTERVVRERCHPYTAGLMASIPSVRTRRPMLKQIDGTMPRLGAIPRGCAFNPRCERADDVCRRETPVLTAGGRHAAACHHPLSAIETADV